jgi:hypothetical protein
MNGVATYPVVSKSGSSSDRPQMRGRFNGVILESDSSDEPLEFTFSYPGSLTTMTEQIHEVVGVFGRNRTQPSDPRGLRVIKDCRERLRWHAQL